MLGAILGDMVGSPYEWTKPKEEKFKFFHDDTHMTDDSLLTIEVARTLLNHYPFDYSPEAVEKFKRELIRNFAKTWNDNKTVGWGGSFYRWAKKAYECGYASPYGSFGNGCAMRVSPVGWIAKTPSEVVKLSKIVTEITHNSVEGIKGAECIAMCVFLARTEMPKELMKDLIAASYYPELTEMSLEKLLKDNPPSVTAQGSVPQAVTCFLDTNSFEEALKAAVLIGGDTDTIGAMAGSIAEAYYQKDSLSKLEDDYLYRYMEDDVKELLRKFYAVTGSKKLQ